MNTQPPTLSIEPVMPPTVQPAPPPQAPPRSPATIIAIVLGVLLVLSVIVGFSLYRQRVSTTVSAPTPTPEPPTPTPTPALSAIAAKPAFIQLEEAVATLSAAIAAYTPQDEALTPPTLVLPLGFAQQ